jgi:hypothetical protein
LRLLNLFLELKVFLAGPAKPGAALAYHTGDDFFRLDPDSVIFTEQYFSAQSISSPLSLPVFDNVCRDPVIVNAEVGVVKFNHSFASNLL